MNLMKRDNPIPLQAISKTEVLYLFNAVCIK